MEDDDDSDSGNDDDMAPELNSALTEEIMHLATEGIVVSIMNQGVRHNQHHQHTGGGHCERSPLYSSHASHACACCFPCCCPLVLVVFFGQPAAPGSREPHVRSFDLQRPGQQLDFFKFRTLLFSVTPRFMLSLFLWQTQRVVYLSLLGPPPPCPTEPEGHAESSTSWAKWTH